MSPSRAEATASQQLKETEPVVYMKIMQEHLLEAKNIHKSFGEVIVLEGVNFKIGYNEIVGLIGDKGAGKSTLTKILTGVYAPDRGEIYIKGKRKEDHSVKKARKLGMETVYQEKALGKQ